MESMISIKMNAATGGEGGATVINDKVVEYSNYGRREEEEQEEEYCCTGKGLKVSLKFFVVHLQIFYMLWLNHL